ncbi:MAG: MFS transporter [Coriobacteriia bacterium]
MSAAMIFYVPVSAVFLGSRGLSYTEIFTLESFLLVAMMAADIPSGVLADRVDRRWVLTAGYALNSAACVSYALGHGFWLFAISFVLSGLSIALLSGAQSAYVFEILGKDADRLSTGVFGRFTTAMIVGGIAASSVGSILASRAIALPAVVTAIASCVAIVCTAFLPSQHARSRAGDAESTDPRTGLGDVLQGLRHVFRSATLLYVALASGTGFVLYNAVYTLNQPAFKQAGIPLAVYGIIVASGMLLSALLTWSSGRLERRLGRIQLLIAAAIVAAVGYALLTSGRQTLSVLGFLLILAGMHVRGPIMATVANTLIPDQARATTLSVMNTAGSIAAVALNPLIGWAADVAVRQAGLLVGGTLLLLGVGFVPVLFRYRREQEALGLCDDTE